jgi:hypothetical protein
MKHFYLKTGMGVVEAIIVIAVLTALLLAVANFGRDVFSVSGILQSGLSAQQDARNIVKTIASELRTASPSSLGSYPLKSVADNDVTFYSDIDGDGLKEEVRYYLSGTILKKSTLKPSGLPPSYTGSPAVSDLIADVKNGSTPVFTYYDTNYDGTTAPLSAPINILSVRLIKVMVMVERDPYRSPTPVSVTTQVSLRNLKDNL